MRIDAQHRIERVLGALKDHGAFLPAELAQRVRLEGEHVASVAVALVDDLALLDACAFWEQAHKREAERGLAAAALADEGERLTLLQLEADAAHGAHQPTARRIVNPKIVYLQGGLSHYLPVRKRGLKTSSSERVIETSDN